MIAKSKKLNGAKNAKSNRKITKKSKPENVKIAPAGETKSDKLNTGKNRQDLMQEARQLGVLNFRVLNKSELEEICIIGRDTKGPIMENERVKVVVEGAVSRWKSGWGKESKKETISA